MSQYGHVQKRAIVGDAIRPLVERNAFLALKDDIAKNVLVRVSRRPPHSSCEFLIARPRVVQMVCHDNLRQVFVLKHGKASGEREEVELLPIEGPLKEDPPP